MKRLNQNNAKVSQIKGVISAKVEIGDELIAEKGTKILVFSLHFQEYLRHKSILYQKTELIKVTQKN